MKVILIFAIVHFALAFVTAHLVYGWDFDRVPARSMLSQAVEPVHKVLMFPHDVMLHALLNTSLSWREPVVWGALIVNSLLWGLALYVVLRLVQRAMQRRSDA